ncbi:MAG: ATP-dependent RNA helicase [Clostridia bacterium]|nr:ATP-dependent RNA helicase [Clostridia bacterium]
MENALVERNCYPVSKYKKQILDMVAKNQVSIISAETGAGKSTQVPQYLLEAGYNNVVLTVPSRTAAAALCDRVSNELHSEVGDVVGFQTGYEKNFSKHTRILYTTEGLELMRELHHNDILANGVLIIDELQEWTINVETLIAWIHQKIRAGWKTKVILMSATMDVDATSKFFNNAPVLKIPGKQFHVKEIERRSDDFVDSIYELASKGHNVLAFVPGKREIEKNINALEKMGLDAEMLRLHGDLPLSEQQIVFKPASKPKVILATNIAQTSITIPDIDAVVDSGLERHMENVEGLDTLTIGKISRSDYIQRKGRAGRTKPGIYVWCNDIRLVHLDEFPTPDIYTGSINQIVLKLASIGVDATNVKFFHQPPFEKILASQQTLRTLGAFDNNNQVTKIGLIMAQLPLSVRYARMIVEAHKLGVLSDVVTIAALSEFGGIKKSNVSYNRFSKEIRSDLLAELDCFNFVKQRINSSSDPFDGVIERNYFRVLELRSKLYDILENIYGDVVYSSGNRNDILKACAAGLVEFLYIRESNGWYSNPNDPSKRKLNLFSTTLPSKYMLGLPRNISLKYKGDNGQQTLYLFSSAIMVDAAILKEVAPHLISIEQRKEYDYERNEYTRRKVTLFDGIEIESTDERVNNLKEKRDMLAKWLATMTFEDNFELDPKLARILDSNRDKLDTPERAKEFYAKKIQTSFKNSLPNLKKAKNFSSLRA